MILSSIHNLIYPATCCICGERLVDDTSPICPSCNLSLQRTGYERRPDDNSMARLFWQHTPFARAAAWVYYRPLSWNSQMIYHLKYGQSPETGWTLGEMAAREMMAADFFEGMEVIVPVPLTGRRRRQRGYNQSEAIARGVERATGLPVAKGALARRDFYSSQTSLDAFLRIENVRKAFVAKQPEKIRGRHVLLVDDVCTTGATLAACGAVLVRAGAADVSALVLGFAGDAGVSPVGANDPMGTDAV